MDTNKHKHAAVHKHMRAHAQTVALTLPSSGLSLVVAVSPVSPLVAVSPAGPRPSQLSLPSISAADWEPGGMSCLSAEDLVQGFITSSMPSQFPFTVLFQTGPLKFLSELHSQTQKAVHEEGEVSGLRNKARQDRRTDTETVHLDR